MPLGNIIDQLLAYDPEAELQKIASAETVAIDAALDSHAATSAGALGSTIAPHQRQAAKANRTIEHDREALSGSLKATPKPGDQLGRLEITEEEVKRFIKALLNDGLPPDRVAEELNRKVAELSPNLVFNEQFSNRYLNDMAGLLGLVYIEPNAYMEKCPATYERLASLNGKNNIPGASVKRVKACDGCRYRASAANEERCNLYHKPIISTADDVKKIANRMVGAEPNQKDRLVKIANLVPMQAGAPQSKIAAAYSGATLGPEVDQTTAALHKAAAAATKPKGKTAAVKSAMSESTLGENTSRPTVFTAAGVGTGQGVAKPRPRERFRAEHVAALHQKGASVERIFKFGSSLAGSKMAAKAIKEWVANLKRTGAKVELSKVDCQYLKGKLGTANAIVGDKRCASCVYRKGMHCGLTGGTLLAFPGIERTGAKKTARALSGKPLDGNSMLHEFDLVGQAKMADIEQPTADSLDIEIGTAPTAGEI